MLTEKQQKIADTLMAEGKLTLSRQSDHDYVVAAAYVLERVTDGTWNVNADVYPPLATRGDE